MAHTLHLEKTASLRDNNFGKSQLEPFYQYALNCMFTESLHVRNLISDNTWTLNILVCRDITVTELYKSTVKMHHKQQ